MPEAKPLTRQRVQAVLRKACGEGAKWSRTSRIRGWGSWDSGWKVEGDRVPWSVCYKDDMWRGRPESAAIRDRKLAEYQAALEAAGLPCRRDGDRILVGEG